MGIGTAVKNILGNDRADEDQRRMSQTQSRSNEASSLESRSRLPAGTGPGTLGKSSDPALEQEIERAERNRASQGIAGHGTDAAAAAGGSLEGTHMAQRVSSGLLIHLFRFIFNATLSFSPRKRNQGWLYGDRHWPHL